MLYDYNLASCCRTSFVLEYWKSALLQAGTYYTEIFDWLRTQDFAAML
ncbi:MAG: hypothetical protein R2854_03505 [Caldilineaceae bacterium]